MIETWAVLGALTAGWLLSSYTRGADLQGLFFLIGMIGYPIACVGLGIVTGFSGIKIAAFGFLGFMALVIYVWLFADRPIE